VCMKFKPTICAPPGEIALLIRYAQCTHIIPLSSSASLSLVPFSKMYVEVCKIYL
jgi:hypothetical protein